MPLPSVSWLSSCFEGCFGGYRRRADPSRLMLAPPAAVAISGRLLADVRLFPSGCSGLLEVDWIEARRVEGRTELQFPDCPAPLLASLPHRVEAPQQGRAPIAMSQVLRSDGLSVQRLQPRSGALVMQVGH